MPGAIHVYFQTHDDSGLPIWQVALLTPVGMALGYLTLNAIVALFRLPQALRLRRRVAAVEAAAGDGPVFAAEVVRQAAERLFAEVEAARDDADRDRLRRLCAPDMAAFWIAQLDADAAAGHRYRVSIRRGPRVDYVSLLADRGMVRLRIRAKLRTALEAPDGTRRRPPENRGRRYFPLEMYWTLSRSGGDWVVWSTRTTECRDEYLSEPIIGEPAGSLTGDVSR